MNSLPWLIVAICSAILFSISNALIKLYQPKLGSGLGLLFMIAGALITALFITVLFKTDGSAQKQFGSAPYFAVLGGVIWAIANFFFFNLFTKHTPLSIALPFVVGGIGLGGILAGVLFFGEKMTTSQIFGAIIVLIGSIILAR